MECVNFVRQYVNTEVLALLVPRLLDIIKTNPSIVNKAGVAHVVTSLTSQCSLDCHEQLFAKTWYMEKEDEACEAEGRGRKLELQHSARQNSQIKTIIL